VRAIAVAAVWITGLVTPTGSAGADPVDLHDPRARPVQVIFELSPPEAPGRLDARYGDPAPAWLEPGPEPGQATLRIPAWVMEEVVGHHHPITGSFSDFVWLFDVRSGHVISANVTGSFLKEVDWGFFSSQVETVTETRLSTRGRAGFRAPRARFGHVVHDFCIEDAECTDVPPRPYDPFTGYVNAVGSIQARVVGGVRTTSFSPLGELVLREVDEASVDVGRWSEGAPAALERWVEGITLEAID
jgi:hypothetical protein